MTEVSSSSSTAVAVGTGPELGPDEALPYSIRRCSLGLLDEVTFHLRGRDGGTAEAGVHKARKKMKRLRGLLRLVRDQVGYDVYRNENVVVRDTARQLSAVRDAWVQVETLRSLHHRYSDLLDESTFLTTEQWLLQNHAAQQAAFSEDMLSVAVGTLLAGRARFDRFPFGEVIADDFSAVAPGLHRVYRRGYRCRRRAMETRRPEDLHEWRKRVKYLNARPEACPDERERWLLFALIFERRSMLQDVADRLGTALYAESPGSFVDRIGQYWQSSRG